MTMYKYIHIHANLLCYIVHAYPVYFTNWTWKDMSCLKDWSGASGGNFQWPRRQGMSPKRYFKRVQINQCGGVRAMYLFRYIKLITYIHGRCVCLAWGWIDILTKGLWSSIMYIYIFYIYDIYIYNTYMSLILQNGRFTSDIFPGSDHKRQEL